MDSLVEAYIRTNQNLPRLLRSLPEPRTPVARAMSAMGGPGAGFEEGLRLAQNVLAEKTDPDLFLLFLGFWAGCSLKVKRKTEAGVLLNRAKALRSEAILPEIRSYLTLIEGNAAGLDGDNGRREELYDEALRILPETSARRRSTAWFRALFLARLGRGVEVEPDLEGIERYDPEPNRAPVALARFIACVYTGRTDEAVRLIPVLEQEPDLLAEVGATYAHPKYLLRVMRGEPYDPPAIPAEPPRPTGAPRIEGLPWVRVTKLLLARRTDEALSWARRGVGKEDPSYLDADFRSFSLVRAELSAGNGEAARRVLDLIRAGGNRHYFDDFFLTRAELLAGNREEAARRFAAVLRSVERYRAEGMLDFEIRLAAELLPRDLLWLSRAADRLGGTEAGDARVPAPTAPEVRGVARLLGRSAAILALRETVARFAAHDVPVLITGETGTGKELVARALHEAGPRAALPFVAFNCGAIAETLLETELFGHERGAFTGAERAHRGLFEEAGAGTVFLDEIGEISGRIQVALLRVLETGEIRPVGSARSRRIESRIVAATNASLDLKAEAGFFRKDLLFRLRRLEIPIPALRERPDDILPLANHFLDLGRRPGARAVLSKELRDALLRYGWPGNVRELRNEIERMRLLNSDRLDCGIEDLSPAIRGGLSAPSEGSDRSDASDASDIRGARGERETPPPDPSPRPLRGAPPPALTDEEIERLLHQKNPALRLERLRQLFARHKNLTRGVIARVLGVSLNTATKYVQALEREGFIEKIAPTPSPRSHYFRRRG